MIYNLILRFKKMRLNRNHIAFGALIVSIIGLGWAINTTQPSIDYWLQKQDTLTKGSNSVIIYCKNGGESGGEFDLILEFVNASFSNLTEQPFTQVASTVRVRFLLHKGESNSKKIYFTTPEKTGFYLKLRSEKISFFLNSNPMFPTELRYNLNEYETTFLLDWSH